MKLPAVDKIREAFVKANIPVKEIWLECNLGPSWQSRFKNNRIVHPTYSDMMKIVSALKARGCSFE